MPARRDLLARRGLRRAVALAAVVALAGCGSSGGSKAVSTSTVPPGHVTTTTAALDGASQAEPTKALASYAVGLRTMTVVDTSRPTVGDPKRKIPAASSRTLPLYILYPATGTPSATAAPASDAPIAPGRFPIVEFSHGVTADGPVYSAFFRNWAAAGYVVVAPTFPMTSGAGAWSDLGDYVNQPADVSFILTRIVALDHTAGDPFEGHLATRRAGRCRSFVGGDHHARLLRQLLRGSSGSGRPSRSAGPSCRFPRAISTTRPRLRCC